MSFEHFYRFPSHCIVSQDAVFQLPGVLKEFRIKLPLVLVTDKYVWNIIGKDIFDFLKKDFNVISHHISKPTVEESQKLIEICNDEKVQLIVGVGGGSVIDVAKYAASQLLMPFISIPTIASHDGIASPIASLRGKKYKESFTARPPIAIIADLNIISRSPFKYTISGCSDVLSNYSAVLDWELAHRIKGERIDEAAKGLALLSYEMIKNNTKKIYNKKLEGYEILVKALIHSSLAMCIAGSSRPSSGAEHLISHSIDRIAKKPTLHGLQCGLASIMTLYLHNANWNEFKEILLSIKAPVSINQTKISYDEIRESLLFAHNIRKNRYTILGDTGLTIEAAENVLLKTGIV